MTTSTSLNCSFTLRDEVLIVELRGAIDTVSVLDAVMAQSVQTVAGDVIVVISDVDYINSAGFSALINLAEAITEKEKGVYLVGLQSKVHVVFNSIGAHSVFNILPGLDEALDRIRSARKK